MAKTKVIVADSGGISAPQMMDFWRKVGDGTIDGTLFQQFLANPRGIVAETVSHVTLARAINILDAAKVVTSDQAAKAQGKLPAAVTPLIRYTEATLRECAKTNKQGLTDWRLVHAYGHSLREQRQLFGTDPNHQPCFYNNSWWMETKEDSWATQQPEAGYYLIDFKGRWVSTSWQNQENEIARLGYNTYERAHEAVVSEALLSIYQTHQERLLENWYHWGGNLDSDGDPVYVGGFDHDGLDVNGCPPDWGDGSSLRVCLSRKFQI